jgi:hypothetical protein
MIGSTPLQQSPCSSSIGDSNAPLTQIKIDIASGGTFATGASNCQAL